ncbi:MAG: sulfatase-like hydrolase/transferase [Bryobacteraceae bacterium]
MQTRRQFLSAAASYAAIAQSTRRRPNIVFLLADDAGYECFGPYGSRQYSTPILNKLADSGVKFTNCYSTPLCTPTRVALMTGQSNVRNYTDFGALSPGEYTFAKMFRESGYATAIAGKWQLQGNKNAKGTTPADSGFDQWCLWNTPITRRERYWNPALDVNGSLKPVTEDDYGPDHFSGFLLDFIEKNKDRPFFAYYPMVLTHSPFLPTPLSADRASKVEQRNFEDMVAYTDKIAGRFIERLERLKLIDNTLFVFTSDNGTHHSLRSKLNGRMITGDKGAPTDAGTHVPLIVYAPGMVRGGRVSHDLIDPSDFLPTMADAIGAKVPHSIDGRTFWPQLQGKEGAPRETLFTYYFPRPYAAAYDTPYQHPEVRFARDRRYKLYGDGRFYDVAADPAETRPLTPAAAAPVRVKLQATLDAMPAHGVRIPREHWERSAGAPSPRWHLLH